MGLWELCKNWGRLATFVVVPFTKQGTPLAVGDVSLVIFATLPHCLPKTESYALCFASFLIVIVRVNMPQITLLT